MLVSLFIQNIAVIEKASIDFSTGFTAMTGETGAGKSIIIDAIGAILGERTSKDIIRTGSDRANVTALFDSPNSNVLAKLKELNVPFENEEIQLFREIRTSGKSVCKINSVPVTVAMLREVGTMLVGIHGQHDSYELLSPEIHGKYLDNYGELNELLQEYQDKYNNLKLIKKQLDKLNIDETQKERRIDLLKYQIDEIQAADISIGEKDELYKRRDLIKNSEKIAQNVLLAKELLDGNGEFSGVISDISSSCEYLDYAGESLEKLNTLAEKLRDVEYILQDISLELRNIQDDTDFSSGELEEIEQRIDLLYKLSLKYGENEEEILKTLNNNLEELKNIELSDEKINILADEFEENKKQAITLAKSLSEKRKEFANEFCLKVKNSLQFLNMPNVEFTIELERCNLYSGGCDKIQFLVSANPGEAPKPMSKIASGGELSRIMLAIKTVLSGNDNIDTMIFDEIDTGISGEAANKVGKKLQDVSKNCQVICITHLAQIAAMADNHLLIKKETDGVKTFTNVTSLNQELRIDELARIIGGNEITPLKRKIAKEMLIKS